MISNWPPKVTQMHRSRSKSVPMFGPAIPNEGRFCKSKNFVDFLLTKIINAENAAHRSDKFVSMALRTRPQSSAVRHIGPSLSIVQLRAIAPWRLTLP